MDCFVNDDRVWKDAVCVDKFPESKALEIKLRERDEQADGHRHRQFKVSMAHVRAAPTGLHAYCCVTDARVGVAFDKQEGSRFVKKVVKDTWAASNNLHVGDKIVSVNGLLVDGPSGLSDADFD